MATIAQIDANRANAMLSTGPKTPAGLANSKHNATRHGLSGKQVVIAGEDPAEYDALRAQLVDEHDPATEREAMLIEEIAQNWWRLKRARRVETQVLAKFGELQCILDPEANKAFRTITRYLNTIERSWRTACAELEKLQEKRRAEEVEQAQNALIRLASRRPPQPIGSVSQPTLGATPTPTHQATFEGVSKDRVL